IIASQDGYAVDFLQEQIMGFPNHTVVLECAIRRALFNPEKLQVIGDYSNLHFEKASRQVTSLERYIPRPLMDFAYSQLKKRPEFDRSRCVRCGDCAAICAPEAITMCGFPSLEKNRCISCYCCHEICKYAAIELKPGRLGKAIITVADLLKLR
ncbi:hypothetical protein KY320_02070, partial [Candidatus Woesearchaeota archaeon]|nr:hypothetical protein [Candidatus Woesearchaeota archaeon]